MVKRITFFLMATVIVLSSSLSVFAQSDPNETKEDYIKWIDFTPTVAAMKNALKYDTDT